MVKVIPDVSLIIQVINFLVLMIALNLVLYRPIRKVIKERREKFAAYEADIANLTGQVQESLTEIDRQLVEARRDGFQKKDDIKSQGLEKEKTILGAASDEAEAEIQKVKDQVKSDVASARDALKTEVEAFSRELAQKVLGRSL